MRPGSRMSTNNSNEGQQHFLDKQEIKKLILQGSKRYGKQHANMTSVKVQQVYEEWFGDDKFKMVEKEEVILRLKDMFEAESYPINQDCADCDTLGKVCYTNDNGLSHRISQGTATLEDMQKASPAIAKSPAYKYSL